MDGYDFSGSGDIVNFSCALPDISSVNVTDREFWSFREDTEQGRIPIALFEAVIFCIGTLWNLFIIITYLIKYKLLKEPANFLLFSLAINDLFICLFIIPFSLITAAVGEFVIGSNDVARCVTCSIQGFLVLFLTIVQIHLLALLSIDRCALLSNPMRYKRLKRVWIAPLGVFIVCMVCFVLSIPPAFGFGQWEFNRNFGVCFPRWTPYFNFIYMGIVIVESFIPIIIITVTVIWTYKVVRRFLKANIKRTSLYNNNKEKANEQESQHSRRQTQLVKIFGALIIANLITWSPILIMFFVFIITGGNNVPNILFLIGWLCYLLSPSIHPILESFFIKELRLIINRARKSVRSQVNKAGKSIARMATIDSFKSLPEDLDHFERRLGTFGSFGRNTTKSLPEHYDIGGTSTWAHAVPNNKRSRTSLHLKAAEFYVPPEIGNKPVGDDVEVSRAKEITVINIEHNSQKQMTSSLEVIDVSTQNSVPLLNDRSPSCELHDNNTTQL